MAIAPLASLTLTRDTSNDIINNGTSGGSETPILYAWTIESGATVDPSSASTFYTKTPNPSYNGNDGDVEIFDEEGNKYTNIMSWTLSKNDRTMSETYIVDASSEEITLNAIGPA